MDANEKIQIGINTLTAQRNSALNTVVEQQVRVSELENDLAVANARIVELESRFKEEQPKEEPLKPKRPSAPR